jgi:hypothetical protein
VKLISRDAALRLMQERLDLYEPSKRGWGGVVIDLKQAIAKLPTQEIAMAEPANLAIDTAGRLAAVKVAIKEVVDTFTYMGVHVGSYITDDELTQVAQASIKARDDFDNAPSI